MEGHLFSSGPSGDPVLILVDQRYNRKGASTMARIKTPHPAGRFFAAEWLLHGARKLIGVGVVEILGEVQLVKLILTSTHSGRSTFFESFN